MSQELLDWYSLSTGTNHIKTACRQFEARSEMLEPSKTGSGRLFMEVSSDRAQFKEELSCSGDEDECAVTLNTKITLKGEAEDCEDIVFSIEADYMGIWDVNREIVNKALQNDRYREELINFFVYQLYSSVKRHIENQLEHFGVTFPGVGLPSSLPPEVEFTDAVEAAE